MLIGAGAVPEGVLAGATDEGAAARGPGAGVVVAAAAVMSGASGDPKTKGGTGAAAEEAGAAKEGAAEAGMVLGCAACKCEDEDVVSRGLERRGLGELLVYAVNSC